MASVSAVPVTIDELTVADAPAAWAALGFALEGDTCVLGGVRIRLAGDGAGGRGGVRSGGGASAEARPGARTGLLGWSLRGAASTDLDGLATTLSDREPPAAPPVQPNGVTAVDHVVAMTPDLERTVAALRAAGLDLRRIREEPTPAGAPRQAFFRLGAVVLEVVQEPPEAIARAGGDHPALFWGLALAAPDLDATVARLGEAHVSEPRPAVQPGRRIATLRRAAGLAVPVALITPPPRG